MKNERKNNSKESQNLVSEEQEEESFNIKILSLTLAQQTT